MSYAFPIGKNEIAFAGFPERLELRVVDKNGRTAGGIGAVFQIVAAAIPEQGGTPGVEKHRGKCVVFAVDDQLPLRCAQERLGQAPRGKVRVEDNERQVPFHRFAGSGASPGLQTVMDP